VVERRTRDRKVAGSTPGRGAIKSTRSTQPCVPPRYVNRVPACMAGVWRGVFTCVEWQVTLCDPIWQVTSRSSEMGFPWRAISAFCELIRQHKERYWSLETCDGCPHFRLPCGLIFEIERFVMSRKWHWMAFSLCTKFFSRGLTKRPIHYVPCQYAMCYYDSFEQTHRHEV